MITRIFAAFQSVLQDESTNTPSFGKSASVPFLISAWLIGTVYGGRLLWAGENPDDLIWSLAGIAIIQYGAYKTGNVLVHRTKAGRVHSVPKPSDSEGPAA